MKKSIRPWCAIAQFPGFKEFLGGTVIMPDEAKSHEIEEALQKHFSEFLPPGFIIVKHVAGSLFFVEEEHE